MDNNSSLDKNNVSKSPRTSKKTTDAAVEQEAESVTTSTTSPEPSPIGDMDGHVDTGMDVNLSEVCYGQCISNDDGTHLDVDIPDDKSWQS